jgi:uncharacterized pyridoxamine 5'-phosphate oxidase family protein
MSAIDKKFLYEFILKYKYAVLSTVTDQKKPEAALVGIACTPDLKLFFDTVSTSRKYQNLVKNPTIAFVIGWENEQTLQYEGIAKISDGEELKNLLSIYFSIFPDGKERQQNWKDITYFVVEPTWIRYSDFTTSEIKEFTF